MRILFLDLDTLRADHLGCYGYHRNTSPNIDKIATQGVRFNNYYCSDAPCLPSRAALMTGRFGIHTGAVGHGGTAADIRLEGMTRDFRDILASESLPSVLREAGFKTVTISPFAERHSAWTFYAGFNEMHNTGKEGMESAEVITPAVLKWIERSAKEDNWFLHVNYWDPHTPYRAPAEFGNPFKSDPLPGWINDDILKKHNTMVGPHCSQEVNMYDNTTSPLYPRQPGEVTNIEGFRNIIDGYDCGIRYMDEHIGTILDAFEKQGILDDLAIIVSSDHGENFGELGIYAEHATADHITCRIPMIIRWPGCKVGHVANSLHYNLDLAPTLADLFNIGYKKSWDGQSYLNTILKGYECGRESLILSQCAHVCQRSVRFGQWIYIRTYHDGYHLFPGEMLFNLDKDPHEQYDVAAENPDICREAVYTLNQWHDDMMKTMTYDVDPLWTVIKEGGPYHAKGHLRNYCDYLEKTGRGYAIPELRRKHWKEFL